MTRAGAVASLFAAAALVLPILAVLAPLGLTPLFILVGGSALVLDGPGALWQRLPRPALAAIAAVLTWCLVSSLWSPAIGEALLRAAQLVGETLLGLSLLALALRLGPEEGRRTGLALAIGIAVALILLAIEIATGALFQSLLDPTRPDPFIAYKRVATLLAILVWPAAAVLGREPGVGRRRLAPLLVLATGIVIFRLEGEAAKLAFALSAAAYGLSYWRPRAGAALLVAGAVATVVLPPLVVPLLPPVGRVATSGLPIGPSGLHRLLIWGFVAGKIAERPWTGQGFNSARSLPRSHADTIVPLDRPLPDGRTELRSGEVLPLHPHNMSLQIWMEMGLVGATLMAAAGWLLLRPLAAAAWRGRAGTAPAIAMIAAGVTVGLLSYGIWQAWWVAGLWFAVAWAALIAAPAIRGDQR